ncbi:hypothetical protein [Salmonella enterica]|uniref:VgrG protein n=2 Tax=Salmonella enterica TaxID=28901 RepID=A0A379QPL4_SALER|nr:hypothetical protein [Salmonella enterica]ASG89129.1 hypothetical protein LFZ47_17090 [Salmonella enterica subsp. salamae serovar 55:k:z39 str. 1315K]SUF58261.1 VgrG protein [Salmonella enterica]
MSSAGLRFTLKVDGIQEMSTAVVSFSLHQKYSIPFALEVDIASGLFDLAAIKLLVVPRSIPIAKAALSIAFNLLAGKDA